MPSSPLKAGHFHGREPDIGDRNSDCQIRWRLSHDRDLDRTVESIAQLSRRDADRYRTFTKRWMRIHKLVQLITLRSPSVLSVVRNAITRRLAELPALIPALADVPFLLRCLSASMSDLLNDTFESEQLKAVLAFTGPALACQSPAAPGTAFLAMSMAGRHVAGVNHPRGGSGMLTESLASMLTHHGGRIMTATVRQIIVDDHCARGIELADGSQITARVVISAVDPKQTLLRLLPPACLDGRYREKVESIQVSDGCAMKVDLALSELPLYRAATEEPTTLLQATQFICPSVADLERAFHDYERGRPAKNPSFMVGTHTVGDASLAPAGRHTMALESRYSPYGLASGGRSWDEIRDKEADRLLECYSRYAPNIGKAIVDRRIMTPLDMERQLGLPRGNMLHCDISRGQGAFSRPMPDLAGYRTPIANLYLSGAGTFPGGGIWGNGIRFRSSEQGWFLDGSISR